MGARARRRGLTLIEVLIVIVVVAILAAIVIPRLWPTAREARESQLRGQLYELRNSIGLFQAHTGDYPAQLTDLLATDASGMVGASGMPIIPDSFRGPYFIPSPTGDLPIDPITGLRDWVYDPATGEVHSGAPGISSLGDAYSEW